MPARVVWKEGLFIRPQHFQQSDRYFLYEMQTRTRQTGVNNWGFFRLDIDNSYLESGKVVLNHASGIMPDGALFSIDAKEYGLSRDVTEEHSGKALYLALPITMELSDEVRTQEEQENITRMAAYTMRAVPNSNVDEMSQADIVVARYDFRLLFEEELSEGYISIKVCEVGDVSAGGSVSLQENYMPTFRHLDAATGLVAKINAVVSALQFRALKLAEKLSDATVQTSELGDYLMMQLLNRTQSRLHYFLTQEKVHPGDMFLELASLAGELAIYMKAEKRLLEEFTYNHTHQAESFEKLLEELHSMLTMVLEQKSSALAIQKQKYGIYTARLSEDASATNASFVLAVKADLAEEQLKKLLLANLKIGTVETIRDLVNYHLAGFKLKPLATAPRQIPYKVNYIYFKIDLKADEREKLTQSGTFAFHLAGEIPNIEYIIWAIRND